MQTSTMRQTATPSSPPRYGMDDLVELCKREGFALRKQGKSWGGNRCPNRDCGESTNTSNKFSVFQGRDDKWRFKCQACGFYGDAADFLAMARNITLRDAMRELGLSDDWQPRRSDPKPVPSPTQSTPSAFASEAMRKVMAMLKAHALDTGPRGYLKQRGIRDHVIDMAVESGQLRMLPTQPGRARDLLFSLVGASLLQEAGLLKPGSDWPAIAFRPLIAIEPGGNGAEFRRIEENDSPKAIRYGHMQWPWFFKRVENPETVMVVEGFIDTLSVLDGLPDVDAIMGVPGVNGWNENWFRALKTKQPGTTVLTGFDNDKAGEKNLPVLDATLAKLGIPTLHYPPPSGYKDWNDWWKHQQFFH